MRAATLWTPEKLAKLRELAGAGYTKSSAAMLLGVSIKQVKNCAFSRQIRFGKPRRELPHPTSVDFARAVETVASAEDQKLRKRWEAALPAMRARLRTEVAAIMTRTSGDGDGREPAR